MGRFIDAALQGDVWSFQPIYGCSSVTPYLAVNVIIVVAISLFRSQFKCAALHGQAGSVTCVAEDALGLDASVAEGSEGHLHLSHHARDSRRLLRGARAVARRTVARGWGTFPPRSLRRPSPPPTDGHPPAANPLARPTAGAATPTLNCTPRPTCFGSEAPARRTGAWAVAAVNVRRIAAKGGRILEEQGSQKMRQRIRI